MFGAWLRGERERRGETQQELADRAGLTEGAISLFESGKRYPSRTSRKKLARALGMSPDAMLAAAHAGQDAPPVGELRGEGLPEKDLARLVALWPRLSASRRRMMLALAFQLAETEAQLADEEPNAPQSGHAPDPIPLFPADGGAYGASAEGAAQDTERRARAG